MPIGGFLFIFKLPKISFSLKGEGISIKIMRKVNYCQCIKSIQIRGFGAVLKPEFDCCKVCEKNYKLDLDHFALFCYYQFNFNINYYKAKASICW